MKCYDFFAIIRECCYLIHMVKKNVFHVCVVTKNLGGIKNTEGNKVKLQMFMIWEISNNFGYKEIIEGEIVYIINKKCNFYLAESFSNLLVYLQSCNFHINKLNKFLL